jgi:hypothetical protein
MYKNFLFWRWEKIGGQLDDSAASLAEKEPLMLTGYEAMSTIEPI